MALTNNFLPNTSLVFGVRDFVPQIDALQKGDTEGLQNAFKFGTQVYDAIKNRQIADEMEKEDPDYKKIDALAAKRINNPDTSFSNWRWKQGQDQQKALREEELAQAKAEKEAAKELAKRQILNEVTNTLPTMSIGMETTPEQRQQYLNTLAGLKTKAQNAGVPIEMITRKEAELAGELPSIKLQNSYTNFENMTDLFDKKSDAGGFANNIKAYKDAIWNEWQAHPEFHDIPAYRQAYIKAMNAHNPVQRKPGTKPSKRK